MKQPNAFQQLKQFDDSRQGIPGEHWVSLGLGLGAWWLARRHPYFMARAIGLGVGAAMVGRAASGRDGLSRIFRLLAVGTRAYPATFYVALIASILSFWALPLGG